MARIGLAMLVVLLLAAGRANANDCGLLGERCCINEGVHCDLGLFCDPSNLSGCAIGLVWQGGSEGGAAQMACPGTCVPRHAAPAASTHTTMLMGAGLLLLGLWSVRRVVRRR